ncbi:hypothetical protein K438DRAFT_1850173 [Mycena galopus ATCC 62051]|nr:hypothetical protein K438DRAFT_1850173 [Mycena galopus ATCC 62051]
MWDAMWDAVCILLACMHCLDTPYPPLFFPFLFISRGRTDGRMEVGYSCIFLCLRTYLCNCIWDWDWDWDLGFGMGWDGWVCQRVYLRFQSLDYIAPSQLGRSSALLLLP